MHWPLVPPSEVFWAPEDIKQAQRRQLEADTLTHDEVAHDHLQITIEKKLANECGMCQGRAGIYHCGSCHQRSHEIDGLLHVRLPAGHRGLHLQDAGQILQSSTELQGKYHHAKKEVESGA